MRNGSNRHQQRERRHNNNINLICVSQIVFFDLNLYLFFYTTFFLILFYDLDLNMSNKTMDYLKDVLSDALTTKNDGLISTLATAFRTAGEDSFQADLGSYNAPSNSKAADELRVAMAAQIRGLSDHSYITLLHEMVENGPDKKRAALLHLLSRNSFLEDTIVKAYSKLDVKTEPPSAKKRLYKNKHGVILECSIPPDFESFDEDDVKPPAKPTVATGTPPSVTGTPVKPTSTPATAPAPAPAAAAPAPAAPAPAPVVPPTTRDVKKREAYAIDYAGQKTKFLGVYRKALRDRAKALVTDEDNINVKHHAIVTAVAAFNTQSRTTHNKPLQIRTFLSELLLSKVDDAGIRTSIIQELQSRRAIPSTYDLYDPSHV
jgi:hypothetical protein